MSNDVSCTPPFDDTEVDEDFFCDTTACNFSLPNCKSVRMPNRAEEPGTSEEFEGKVMFPPSTSLMISSSLPSYLSFMFCAS